MSSSAVTVDVPSFSMTTPAARAARRAASTRVPPAARLMAITATTVSPAPVASIADATLRRDVDGFGMRAEERHAVPSSRDEDVGAVQLGT